MPRPKKTSEEIAEMRERILSAAMELLEEKGAAGLSIRKIGRRLGVSHMVLYTYFENRNAVVEALKERWLEHLRAKREEALQKALTGDALAVLRGELAHFVQFSHEHPRIYRLVWVHCGSDELARDRSRHTEEHLTHLAHLVELCIERGQCQDRDPRTAAAMAFREGMKRGAPVMLEPIMRIEVVAPEAFTGDIISELNMRRAGIEGIEPRGNNAQTVRAHVPLATMFGYATSLRSRTQGRGIFVMEFAHYAPVSEKEMLNVVRSAA